MNPMPFGFLEMDEFSSISVKTCPPRLSKLRGSREERQGKIATGDCQRRPAR
jgi:hypothetical protein